MNEYEINQEIARVRDARRLGGFDKTCVICGEPDQRCLELHHIAGRSFDGEKVPVCRNCHRKVTDKTANKTATQYPSKLDQIGHWLLGLAEFLLALAKRAFEFGNVLIECAQHAPRPYGYRPEGA